jgi:hypothetical protein
MGGLANIRKPSTHPVPTLLGWITTRVKVKFTLEQAMKAQRRSRGIALIFRKIATVIAAGTTFTSHSVYR